MNLRQLQYFKTIAELEHYTRAAEKLYVSQSNLSHSIQELEDELIITGIATRFGDEGPNHQIKSPTANLEGAPPVTEPVAPTTAAPSAFTNSDDDAFDQIVDFFKK